MQNNHRKELGAWKGVTIGQITDSWREGGWTLDYGLSLFCTLVQNSVQVGPMRNCKLEGKGECELGCCSAVVSLSTDTVEQYAGGPSEKL